MQKSNIFSNIIPSNDETFLNIIEHANIKIERIVSTGQTSPEDFWYDQEQHEFVIVIKGFAIVEFEDKEVELKEGDYLNIEAHCKHRVKYTSTTEETIWLAVFYD